MSAAKKLVIVMIVCGALLFSCAVNFGLQQHVEEYRANCTQSSPVVAAQDVSIHTSGLTVKGVAINDAQAKLAATIIGTVRANGFDNRIAEVAISTVIVESSISNPVGGDATSAGPFQQQEWWGTLEQRRDPVKSTTMFIFGGELGSNNYSEPGVVDIDGWRTIDRGELAAEVQQPAEQYRGRYTEAMPEAEKIVAATESLGGVTTSQTVNVTCKDSPIEKVVEAALSQVGESYSWDKPTDNASFASWAYAQAGIELPSDIDNLVKYKGDSEAGVSVTWVPISSLKELKRGDITVWGRITDESNSERGPPNITADHVGIYAGQGLDGLKVATYNVHGSSHTAKTGPKAGVNRIVKSAKLIRENGFAVVGLQELQRDQRTRLLELLGEGWGIWPKGPVYHDSKKHTKPNAQNAIIWDKSQVSLVKGDSLPMPFYFRGYKLPRDIPLVRLVQNDSGQEFYVANTHDPAHPENALFRKLDAERHARDLDALAATGLPVFMTGDFNSGFGVRSAGNTTYGNDRNNLTWCILTRSGTMLNGYDAAKTPVRTGRCPRITTQERGIGVVDHVYVSSNVRVSDYRVIERSETASDHKVVYITAGFGPSQSESSSLGSYVGFNAKTKKIDVQPVRKTGLLGVLRVTVSPVVSQAVWSPTGNVVFPLPPGSYVDKDNYGARSSLWSAYHTGNDYSAPCGTQVVAVTSGTVDVSASDSYGTYFTKIQTGQGQLTIWYAHMQKLFVSDGAEVVAGQLIGEVGQLGNTTGCHLHLEIHPRSGGYAQDDVDPHKWFIENLAKAA